MSMKKCIYCNLDKDCRPYGPNGSELCFSCMMEKPERETEAKRQLLLLLESHDNLSIIDDVNQPPRKLISQIEA